MSEGRYSHQINEHNPFNINIEFNINGRRRPQEQPQTSERRPIESTQPKLNLCNCQPPRTPDPAQTDRNTYSKDPQYLQPMEDPRLKRKSKKNSMDINITSRSNHPDTSNKSKIKSLMQTQLFKKVDPKKKRTFSKYEGEGFKKGLQDGVSKSAAIQAKSGKKGQINHSLKSIIHKIVYSELSKRTLGTSLSKGKSPYQLHSSQNAGGSTSRKKQKRRNVGSKSDKQIKGEQFISPSMVVQKLNSLKSMSASIVRSDVDEPQMAYYSKKRGRIHIHTDNQIDFIEEIAYFEKKGKREYSKKEDVSPVVLEQTTQLIENYIQLMQMSQQSEHQRKSEDEVQQEGKSASLKSEKDSEKRKLRKNMRQVLSKEMDDLFVEGEDEIASDISEKEEHFSNEFIDKEKQKTQKKDLISGEKLRPFLSSEIERGGLSGQLERIKLQELKKQEIEKWGYLLEYIKKNMGSEEADTQLVLNEVYSFLERSKNDLQLDLAQDGTIQKPSKQLDEEFTVKYSQNREQEHHAEYFRDSPPVKKEENISEDEDVASFREEYTTEENEDLKLLNLDTISGALKQRKDTLMSKKEKELNALELKKHSSKISEQQYEQEREKIIKWTKRQLTEISKAKKNIWQGYREARGILDKTLHSRKYEEQSTSGKMMKCLSETYLKKAGLDYTRALKVEKKEQKNQSVSSESNLSSHSESYKEYPQKQQSEEVSYKDQQDLDEEVNSEENVNPSPLSEPLGGSQELSLQKSEEMEAIKERLLKMKHEHFAGDDSSDNISYQEVEKDLDEDYSDEEMAIINKEMGGSTAKSFSNLQTKLKYCCAEDKEDIFEFIFLDLCIELYQESCSQNRIMKSINHFVTRAQVQAKKKKGVKTNLNVVKQYLKRFSNFLFRTNKPALQNLSNPMGPSAIQMLRYMHDGDYDIKDDEEEAPTFIIPVSSFEKFQQGLLPTLEFEQYYDDPEKEEARVGFLKTILHIHNRALFDSMNQFLDHERPFGIWGSPFPWKRAACFPHVFTESQLEEKLKKSTDKVVEQCSYVCGLLADKEESLVGNAKISEAYIQQIREDRLSRMLANELVQSEERWLFYDDEETEVLVQLSNFVWLTVLNEAKSELRSMQK